MRYTSASVPGMPWFAYLPDSSKAYLSTSCRFAFTRSSSSPGLVIAASRISCTTTRSNNLMIVTSVPGTWIHEAHTTRPWGRGVDTVSAGSTT